MWGLIIQAGKLTARHSWEVGHSFIPAHSKMTPLPPHLFHLPPQYTHMHPLICICLANSDLFLMIQFLLSPQQSLHTYPIMAPTTLPSLFSLTNTSVSFSMHASGHFNSKMPFVRCTIILCSASAVWHPIYVAESQFQKCENARKCGHQNRQIGYTVPVIPDCSAVPIFSSRR